MAAAEMFLPKQHLHFAGYFQRRRFPLLLFKSFKCAVTSVGLQESEVTAPVGEHSGHFLAGGPGADHLTSLTSGPRHDQASQNLRESS